MFQYTCHVQVVSSGNTHNLHNNRELTLKYRDSEFPNGSCVQLPSSNMTKESIFSKILVTFASAPCNFSKLPCQHSACQQLAAVTVLITLRPSVPKARIILFLDNEKSLQINQMINTALQFLCGINYLSYQRHCSVLLLL